MSREAQLYAFLILGLMVAYALVYCVCFGLTLLWDRGAEANAKWPVRRRHLYASAGVLAFSVVLMLSQLPARLSGDAVGWLAVTALLPAGVVVLVARVRLWMGV
jgi:hypothetical protein